MALIGYHCTFNALDILDGVLEVPSNIGSGETHSTVYGQTLTLNLKYFAQRLELCV